MQKTAVTDSNKKKKALFKAIILVAFIIAAICLIRFTSVSDYLTPDAMGRFLKSAGLWAPFVYVILYAAGVCLFLPGTLLTGLGAAIFGAVVGGAYKSTQQAQRKMTGVGANVYRPTKDAAKVYAQLYKLYRTLHDAFGTTQSDGRLDHVMKELIAIRDRARKE